MDRTSIKIITFINSRVLKIIVRDQLKRAGFVNIRSVDTGQDGIKLAKTISPDLLLVDFDMPDMNGLEVLTKIRNDPALRDLAFIMISSDPEEKFVAQAAEFRVSAYIVKPFNQDTLVAKVNRVLEQVVNPSEGLLAYHAGNHLVAAGKLDEALDKYRTALEATQYAMAAVYYKMGRIHEQLEDEPAAENNYHEAVGRSIRYVDAYDALGRLMLRQSKNEAALGYITKSSKISPLNAERQKILGEVLLNMEDLTGAEDAFRKSLELDPTQSSLFHLLGITMRRQYKLDEAEHYFQRALRSDDNNPDIHYNLGQVYHAKKDLNKAIAHLNRALELEPDFEAASHLLNDIRQEREARKSASG